MRLRTLPLSTAGVLLGILLAVADWKVDPWVAVLIVLTTISLQILSNLSNELGDVLQGTDTAERQGPQYGLNGGGLTMGEMKRLIGMFVGLCVVFGTAMTWRAFGTLLDLTPILVLLLGAGAEDAAKQACKAEPAKAGRSSLGLLLRAAEKLLAEKRRSFVPPKERKPGELGPDMLFADYMIAWLAIAKSNTAVTTYNGYVEHDWNVSSADSDPSGPVAQDFIDNIAGQAVMDSAIILMHSSAGHEETVKALPEIIRVLREKGYAFGVVTPMTPQPW